MGNRHWWLMTTPIESRSEAVQLFHGGRSHRAVLVDPHVEGHRGLMGMQVRT